MMEPYPIPRYFLDVHELQNTMKFLEQNGNATHQEVQAHLLMRPYDYCPFECALCELCRAYDDQLTGKADQETPVT